MKIILSRKGLDSGNSPIPSPIMPDRTPLSIPIPRKRGARQPYDQLRHCGARLSDIIEDLTEGSKKKPLEKYAHVDPDLVGRRLGSRKKNWRPIFGQTGADQTHLSKQGVGVGDLFLFFGWFRETRCVDGRLCFAGAAGGFHVLFGWLQVGQACSVTRETINSLPPWAQDHPHVVSWKDYAKNNTIYIASRNLDLHGVPKGISGGGVFPKYTDNLRLTAPGKSRSVWRLPRWFYPGKTKPPLTYHGNRELWTRRKNHSFLKTVGRGQEFALDADHYPEAIPWVASLFHESK